MPKAVNSLGRVQLDVGNVLLSLTYRVAVVVGHLSPVVVL